MKLIRRIPPFLRNKFFLAGSFFVLWMTFFDKNDVFTILERRKELKELELGKAYYEKEIADNKQFALDLKSNPAAIEKYAREKFLMKKDNEDLYVVARPEGQ